MLIYNVRVEGCVADAVVPTPKIISSSPVAAVEITTITLDKQKTRMLTRMLTRMMMMLVLVHNAFIQMDIQFHAIAQFEAHFTHKHKHAEPNKRKTERERERVKKISVILGTSERRGASFVEGWNWRRLLTCLPELFFFWDWNV